MADTRARSAIDAPLAASGSARAVTVGISLGAVILVVALYGRVLGYDELVWTDSSQIGQGTVIRPPGRWTSVFTHPLHELGQEGAAGAGESRRASASVEGHRPNARQGGDGGQRHPPDHPPDSAPTASSHLVLPFGAPVARDRFSGPPGLRWAGV